MKRLIFALALAALVSTATRNAEAEVDVSIDFFYNNLNTGGSWVEVGDYGYCWQPEVAVTDASWRPYSDGSWVYTDVGWTWVSNEPFGWATYHYGRWAMIDGRGWVWVPGREWGPAWVSWRTGGDYVGWAPLPPRYSGGAEVVYDGRPIGGAVDIEFDIGPAYYNFVNVRYIGEPLLRGRIYAPTQNITYISRTVNVTNITYNNTVVYNYGPDINRLSAYSARPIRRLKLQRENNVDYNAVAQAGGITRVQGDSLVVAAPMTLQRPAQSIAPRVVKEKIAQPKLQTGWAGAADSKAKTALQEKMKKEDAKAVPPPTMKPNNPAETDTGSAAAAAAATPPDNGTAGGVAAPGQPRQGKGKNKRDAALDSAGAPPSTPADQQRGKGKNKKGEANQPAADTATPDRAPASVPPPSGPAAPADGAKKAGKGKNKGRQAAPSPVSPSAPAVSQDAGAVNGRPSTAPPANGKDKGKGEGKAKHRPMPTDGGVGPVARDATAPAPQNGAAGPRPDPRPSAPQPHGKKADKPAKQAGPQAPPVAQPRDAAPQATLPPVAGKPKAVGGGKAGKGDKKKKKDSDQPAAQ